MTSGSRALATLRRDRLWQMHEKVAEFRFYEELNDFLPLARRKVSFAYRFSGTPSVKGAIEAVGVPHTDIDLVVVNGYSVGFEYHLRHGDRVAVYPTFESLDTSPVTRLKARPLRDTRFVIDSHLGKLARLLRMLGFDALYKRDYEAKDLVAISLAERRIILTRDRGVLKHSAVTHGYWLRSTDPKQQVREVVERLALRSDVSPFRRCMLCNGMIEAVDRAVVLRTLPPAVAKTQTEFHRCASCGKVYWRGTHYERMRAVVDGLLERKSE